MTAAMNVAVVTVVAGRHSHLRAQLHGLTESSVPATHHVIVSMGDDAIAGAVLTAGSDAHVVTLPRVDAHLPLARARNLGARIAASRGAELLVFLDVDCIPGPEMLARYVDAATSTRHRDSVLCGPVTYLPPNPSGWTSTSLRESTDPHHARPNPADGHVTEGTNYDLFWSLSFAVTPQVWERIGGFFEGYSGYGGEDTDFAASARAAGIGLRWVGGAHAYHQHHAVSSPPVEHVDDIVRNSRLFHQRWNRWPMEGWLAEFERRGMIERDDHGYIARTELPRTTTT